MAVGFLHLPFIIESEKHSSRGTNKIRYSYSENFNTLIASPGFPFIVARISILFSVCSSVCRKNRLYRYKIDWSVLTECLLHTKD